MANKVNVRIEAKRYPIAVMLRILKRACNDAGVTKSLNEHAFFIRKTDLKRRKKMNKLKRAADALDPEKVKKEKEKREFKNRG